MEIRTDVIDVKIESKRKYDIKIKIDAVIEKEEKEDDMEIRTDDSIQEEVKKDVIDEKLEKEEDHVSHMNSETVTKVELEESNCKEVIEKGEELKKEDSVKDVQQSEDRHICVIDDYKKVEVEKNDFIEKEEVFDLNEKEDVQQSDNAEISVIDDIMEIKTDDEIEKEGKEDDKETRIDNAIENDKQEDVIDLNEIEVEQKTYDAEISVIDDCKNLEIGKNDIMEIKTDDENEKEEKEDEKETRTDNVINNEEQEDVIDINEREVEQQTDDAEISVTLEVEKNDDIGRKTDDVIETEEKEDVIDLELETGMNDDTEIKTDDVIEKEEKEDDLEIKTDAAIEKEEKEDDMEIRTDDAIEEEVKKHVIDAKLDDTETKKDDGIEKEEKEDIVDGSEREDHISIMKSEAVTEVESENTNSKDVIEKGEELKKEDSVEDDKNEYVQQTDDMDISVINDSKKLEVEKNHVIGKDVINVN